jgi:hypothetical protein
LFDARSATQQAASLLALATDDRNNPTTSLFLFPRFSAQISEKYFHNGKSLSNDFARVEM